MKAITFWLSMLCLVPFGNSQAQGLFLGSPIYGRGGFWELGTMTLVQPMNSGTFYTTNRPTGGNNFLRTELNRQNGWMQRAYVRSNTALNQHWLLYAMYDVAYHHYDYGSREYFSDGTLYRINEFTGNNPSRSFQQAITFGAIYQKPINERLRWRLGGGAGILMGIFEEEMPWLTSSFLLPNLTGSVRLATQWEAGIDWQLSEKHNNLSLIAGYVFHHAFAHNENIINHHLATHHGLQLGFRFGVKTKKLAQRRSDVIGY